MLRPNKKEEPKEEPVEDAAAEQVEEPKKSQLRMLPPNKEDAERRAS